MLMVNDTDRITWPRGPRRMRVHDLHSNSSSLVSHPLCHNLSSQFEKNWGSFYYNHVLHFVYTVDPLVIIRTNNSSDPIELTGSVPREIACSPVSMWHMPKNMLDIFKANGLKMRGGTPGLCVGPDEYLFVGHSVTEKEKKHDFPDFLVQSYVDAEAERTRSSNDRYYRHYSKLYAIFFYTIKKDVGTNQWNIDRISCCSHLPGKTQNMTKIVFPCGLTRAKLAWDTRHDSYIVSYGERDQHCNYCAMTEQFLQYILRPVEEWTEHNYVVDVNYFNNVTLLDLSFKTQPFRRGGSTVLHSPAVAV
jgi:hypothetical protein